MNWPYNEETTTKVPMKIGDMLTAKPEKEEKSRGLSDLIPRAGAPRANYIGAVWSILNTGSKKPASLWTILRLTKGMNKTCLYQIIKASVEPEIKNSPGWLWWRLNFERKKIKDGKR